MQIKKKMKIFNSNFRLLTRLEDVKIGAVGGIKLIFLAHHSDELKMFFLLDATVLKLKCIKLIVCLIKP